jgi:histidyl-tRNA synthetase
VFLAGVTEEDLPHVLALAHELRDAGLRAEYALSAQALGKQLKLADARNARIAVVVGPDDRARGEVMVRDLAEKSQQAVRRNEVVSRLAGVVAR